jgi:hypothetical protein
MAKRFTDTEKWKKAFIKKLPPELKLLWFYILDDCDISGLWQVDIEVASIRIGIPIDINKAIREFDENIIIIDNGEKWFIPSFLEFQYGSQLSKTNNIFRSIEKILNKYDLYQYLNIEITESGTTIGSYRNRISQLVRDKVYLQDEFTCQYCSQQKTKNELVVDHFIPLKKGGDNSDENLVCACTRCNGHKSDILPDIFLEKDFHFLKPTGKMLSLIAAYKTLKAPFKDFKGGKDKDKDMVKDMVKDKEGKNEKIKMAFCGDEIENAWDSWKEYKQVQYKFKYKTLRSEQAAFDELVELSGNDLSTALKIIQQSMAKGWKGLFALKNEMPIQIGRQKSWYEQDLENKRKSFKPIEQHDNDL